MSALPETPARPFGDLLDAGRSRLGMSIPALRRRLADVGHEYSGTLVWYWHTGERMPRLRAVVHLGEALGWTGSDRLAAFDAHASQWDGPARQVQAIATRFAWSDLTRLDAYDTAAASDAEAA